MHHEQPLIVWEIVLCWTKPTIAQELFSKVLLLYWKRQDMRLAAVFTFAITVTITTRDIDLSQSFTCLNSVASFGPITRYHLSHKHIKTAPSRRYIATLLRFLICSSYWSTSGQVPIGHRESYCGHCQLNVKRALSSVIDPRHSAKRSAKLQYSPRRDVTASKGAASQESTRPWYVRNSYRSRLWRHRFLSDGRFLYRVAVKRPDAPVLFRNDIRRE